MRNLSKTDPDKLDARWQYQHLVDYLFLEFITEGGVVTCGFRTGAFDELANLLLEAPDEVLAQLKQTKMPADFARTVPWARKDATPTGQDEEAEEFRERLLEAKRESVRQFAKAWLAPENRVGYFPPPKVLTDEEMAKKWPGFKGWKKENEPKDEGPKKRHRPLWDPTKRQLEPDIAVDTRFTLRKITDWQYPTKALYPWKYHPFQDCGSAGLVALDWPEPCVRLNMLDDKTDIVWDQENVFLLSKDDAGRMDFQPLFSCEFEGKRPEVDGVLRARGDGKNIWIATIKDGITNLLS